MKDWTILISALTLLITIIGFWKSWWQSQAKLKIDETEIESLFLKSFDGCMNDSLSNPYDPKFYSIILIDIIITNKSSHPISIIEFSTPEFPKFNSYSKTKESFKVTYRENSTLLVGRDEPIKYLKPEFIIKPYTSERGFIFFWSGTEHDLDISKKIPITVKTSRKKFKFKVKIRSVYESIKKIDHHNDT